MERDVVSAPLLGLGVDVVSAGHVYILRGSEHSQGTVLRLFTHLCDGAVQERGCEPGGYRRAVWQSGLID